MDLLHITQNLVMIELLGSEISSAAIGTEQDVIGAKKDVILYTSQAAVSLDLLLSLVH